MMSAAIFQQQELFGLFELDEFGTILYSRVESSSRLGETVSDLTGKNFFKEIAVFADADAMRKKLSGFRSGTSVADTFRSLYTHEDSHFPVKILLARIRDKGNSAQTK